MKKVYILFFTLLVAIPSFAQSIFLENNLSESVAVDFTNLQKITFDKENLYLHMNDGSVNPYSMYYYTKITNVEGLSSVDEIMQSEELVEYLSDDQIVVNATAGTIVEIYGVCGAKMATQRLSNDNGTISISMLSKGIYILRAGGRTSKFLKR